MTNAITVNVPVYSKVGKYEYTITEVAGTAQGVSHYDTTPIKVAVLVTYDYDRRTLLVEAGVERESASAEKRDKLYEQYDVGALTVSKAVVGTLGDKTVAFDIDVTFTAEAGKTVWSDITYAGGTDVGTQTIPKNWTGSNTVTIHLKDKGSVTFSNIPAGVSYAVVEQAKHIREGVNDVTRGYTAAYANSDNAATGSGSGAIAAGDADTVAVTNTKNSTIETGVKLDSLPYIVLLAVAVVGMAVALMRRRKGD